MLSAMKITGRRFRLVSPMTARIYGFGMFCDELNSVAVCVAGERELHVMSFDDLPPLLECHWIDPPCDDDQRIIADDSRLSEAARRMLGKLAT
jgi:hypothetical protein